MVRRDKKAHTHHHEDGGLFIPAGLFLGIGFGFIFNNMVAGLFLGLGLGFFCYAVTMIFKKKK